MQTVVNRNKVVNQSSGQERNFTIEASPKMFNILSKQIYSNNVLAVVRELSTNAWDAHKMVGKEHIPFDVCLPNQSNPTFYIRDYGPGLSENDVENLYTSYGKSTKDSSNDAIGCFGLGSKSPFAYNDQFTVESVYNGEKSIYTAFKDTDGMPKITKLCSSKTNEPTGLKVSIAVNTKDYGRFAAEATNVYENFVVIPNFVNTKPVLNKPTYLIKKDKYGIIKGRLASTRIIMGQIAYPIEMPDISKFSEKQRIVLRSGVNMFCNIGDVSLTVSRESLEYDSKTVTTILSIVNHIIQDATTDLNNTIDSYKSLYDVRCNLRKHLDNFCGISGLFAISDVVYKGQKVFPNGHTQIALNGQEGFELIDVGIKRSNNISYINFPVENKYVFIDDKIGMSKVRFAKFNNQQVRYIAITGDVTKFLETIGTTEQIYELSSTLAKKPVAKRNGQINTYVFKKGCYYDSDRWKKEIVDLSQYKYYVLESKGVIYYLDAKGEQVDIGGGKAIDKFIEEFKISDKILKIAPKYEDKLTSAGLTMFYDDLVKYFKKEEAKLPNWQDEVMKEFVGYNASLAELVGLVSTKYKWIEGEKYLNLIPKSQNIKIAKSIHELYIMLYGESIARIKAQNLQTELEKQYKAIFNKFPLLFVTNYWDNYEVNLSVCKKKLDNCVKYIEAIEKGVIV